MGDLVNLRSARKRKARAVKEAVAAVNRVKFGEREDVKKLSDAQRKLETKSLDDHRRELEGVPTRRN